jgi:DNA-directed RNA polymerase specialized sigma24 family protein
LADATTDTVLPATCRALVQREGLQSPAARAAFHAFYDAWYAEVQRWAQARIARPERIGAEDLVVAAFWKAWQWIAGPSSLPGPDVLLRTCLDRAHTDLLRAAYGRAAVDGRQLPQRGADARDPLSLDRAAPDTQALIDSLADSYDVEAVVLEAESIREHLAALPPLDRACVCCRHLEGRSVAATAAYLGVTPDQVKKHTARGLALLTRRLLAVETPPAPGP